MCKIKVVGGINPIPSIADGSFKKKNIIIAAAAAFTVVALLAVGSVIGKYKIIDGLAENGEPAYVDGMDYYNSLDYTKQLLYDAVKDGAMRLKSKTDIIPYEYADWEFSSVMKAVKADNPELFYVDFDTCVFYSGMHKSRVKLTYLEKKPKIKQMREELNSLTEKLVDAANGMNDFEIEAAMHDYIAQHSLHSSASDNGLFSGAYGALILGRADPEGYSLAMKLLMNRAGLYCSLVYGEAKSAADGEYLPHVWNLVKSRGAYYHTDVTFDDADVTHTPDIRFHGYFNLSQMLISKDHLVSEYSAVLPAANTDETYYNTLGLYAASEEELPGIILTALGGAYSSGRNYIEFSKGFEITDDALKELLLAQIAIFNDSQKKDGEEPDNSVFRSECRIYKASEINGATTIQLFYAG